MRIKQGFSLCMALLLALLLCAPALAADDGDTLTLEQRLNTFMEEYGLTEENFSVCYYDTVTGEEFRFNDTTFMFAASTYKLPLNMYYYEMEQNGQIESDALIGETTLADAHYQSMVFSDNDISVQLLYGLGSFRSYKDAMRTYFSMSDDQIDSSYYSGNYYCTAMMLDALKYLYEHQEQFEELIGYMKQAQPNAYFRASRTDYEIAHKYGYFILEVPADESASADASAAAGSQPEAGTSVGAASEIDAVDDSELDDAPGIEPDPDPEAEAAAASEGEVESAEAEPDAVNEALVLNDVGIIYTPQPFLLAVYSTGAADAEFMISRVCELFIDYNLEQYQLLPEQTQQEEADAAEQSGEEVEVSDDESALPSADDPETDLEMQPDEELPSAEPDEADAADESPAEQDTDFPLIWAIAGLCVVCGICICILILAKQRGVKAGK